MTKTSKPRRVVEDGEGPASDAAVPETIAQDLPSAPDVANVFLGGLLLLASLATCYFAASVVLPIVVALVLMLVLQPAMRVLQRLHIPRLVGAIFILVFFGLLAGIAIMLSGPAATWAQKLPSGIPKLQERLGVLSEPIAAFQKLLSRAESLTQMTRQSSPLPVTLAGAGLSDRLLDGTRSAVSSMLETSPGIHSCGVWSRFYPASRTSGRRWIFRSRSKATSRRIW
jgi:predicted PurR-regulated permease PerM